MNDSKIINLEQFYTLWTSIYDKDGKPDWSPILPYYDENIYFRDSIQEIRGIKEFKKMTERLAKRSRKLKFLIHNKMMDKNIVFIEWEISRKDGEKRHLEISANLIKDEDGQKIGFRGIARDVTDRVLAQQALKESEACALELSRTSRRAEHRYRAFLEFLPDPVFVFNLDNTVFYLNPAFEKVFGWSLEELKGKIIPFTDLIPPDVQLYPAR